MRGPKLCSATAAVAVVVTITMSGCAGDDPLAPGGTSAPSSPSSSTPTETSTPTEDPKAQELTVTWLAFRGDGEGTTGETILSRRPPRTPGDFRIEFSANEVGGIGAQSQAGAWNAAIVSTLLLGEPLEGEFSFETSGWIDGPSAGGLTTVGLIALARGEEVIDGTTMTGTINATGMLGPVGGIPEKIQGAADAGFTKVVIPLGQRNSQNHQGKLVDVVRKGDELGVEVVEAGDIYEAYEQLTGVALSSPTVAGDPRLDNASYDKVKPQTDATLSRYDAARTQYKAFPQDLKAAFDQSGVIETMQNQAARARDLQRQGLQAGAFNLAQQAAALAEMLVAAGDLITPLYTQGLAGIETIFETALNIEPAESTFFAFLDQLSTFEPKNIADVEGLVNAYAGTFDAYSLLIFAHQELQAIEKAFENDSYAGLEEMFTHLVLPLLWSELAKAQVESAQAVFEMGRDNPGTSLSDDVELAQVGDFFRRGADANFAAFEEIVVTPLADEHGVSRDVFLGRLAAADLTVAQAVVQAEIQPVIEKYIGEGKPNAEYATLGYGLNNYVRNQSLVDKYYNNAILDENLQIVGVNYDAVLNRALDLGRQHLATEVNLLRDRGTEPVIGVASYESASLYRNGTVSEKFDAVSLYNAGFLTNRMMAYLAGIQNVDLGEGR